MQLLRFLFVGSLNTAVGFICILVAMDLLKIDYRLANIIGYTVGFVISFILNRTWTFQSTGSWTSSGTRWLAVVASCYLLNLLSVILLHEALGVGTIAAQFWGAVVYTCASFLGGKFFAFADHRSGIAGHS